MTGYSHYLPAFTVRRANQLRAICDTFIDPPQHSTYPTCPVCKRLLLDEDEPERGEPMPVEARP